MTSTVDIVKAVVDIVRQAYAVRRLQPQAGVVTPVVNVVGRKPKVTLTGNLAGKVGAFFDAALPKPILWKMDALRTVKKIRIIVSVGSPSGTISLRTVRAEDFSSLGLDVGPEKLGDSTALTGKRERGLSRAVGVLDVESRELRTLSTEFSQNTIAMEWSLPHGNELAMM